MKINILGVNLDKVSATQALGKIFDWTKDRGSHYVVTVNPEFVVAANQQPAFKHNLQQADLAICDGAGLAWAARWLTGEKISRITGVDLTVRLLELSAANRDLKIYLLGGGAGTALAVAQKFPQANIVGSDSGGFLDENWDLPDNQKILDQINDSQANLLLVAFGQIKQENWIAKNLPKLNNIRVALGVGGTFDYLSGQIKRAPAWLRQLGLEWLYRLLRQPRRARRIYNATFKFLCLVAKEKIKLAKNNV